MLPLIPGYLAFISISIAESNAAARRQVLVTSIAFIIGFSLVFVALGAAATSVGQYLVQQITLLRMIAGVILIIFGVRKPTGPFGALVAGIAFAFGWSPSIGPTLAAILATAASQDTVGVGIRLLVVYSMGLAIPFLLTALAIEKVFKAFAGIRRYAHTIELVSGATMVISGVLIFTNRFTLIANYLSQYLPTY